MIDLLFIAGLIWVVYHLVKKRKKVTKNNKIETTPITFAAEPVDEEIVKMAVAFQKISAHYGDTCRFQLQPARVHVTFQDYLENSGFATLMKNDDATRYLHILEYYGDDEDYTWYIRNYGRPDGSYWVVDLSRPVSTDTVAQAYKILQPFAHLSVTNSPTGFEAYKKSDF